MKNKLVDLNNHLFAQLERLSEETLTSEQIDQEVKRTDILALAKLQHGARILKRGAGKAVAS